jgi:hypothetical protein
MGSLVLACFWYPGFFGIDEGGRNVLLALVPVSKKSEGNFFPMFD